LRRDAGCKLTSQSRASTKITSRQFAFRFHRSSPLLRRISSSVLPLEGTKSSSVQDGVEDKKKAWIQEVEQGRREILPRFLIRAGAGRPLPARASVMGCIFTWASTNGRNGGPNDGVEPLGTACGFASVSLCASPTGTRLGFVWSDWQLSLARTDKSAANEPRD
jgi:hypothetical protein